MTYPDATDYCATLPLANGGWRLPTIDELETIKTFAISANGCYLAPCAFETSCRVAYWSSTIPAGPHNPQAHAAYTFAFGMAIQGQFNDPGWVRCVR